MIAQGSPTSWLRCRACEAGVPLRCGHFRLLLAPISSRGGPTTGAGRRQAAYRGTNSGGSTGALPGEAAGRAWSARLAVTHNEPVALRWPAGPPGPGADRANGLAGVLRADGCPGAIPNFRPLFLGIISKSAEIYPLACAPLQPRDPMRVASACAISTGPMSYDCVRMRPESPYTIVWTQLHRREAMVDQDRRVSDPAAHQPTKADMEEDVAIDATPHALAWAVTRGGTHRKEPAESPPD